MTRALFPGSFDPPTLGHLDLVVRAHALFGEVVVGVAAHPTKRSWLSVDDRIGLWDELLSAHTGARAVPIDGLVVDAARTHACDVLLRGVRTGGDLDDELPMAGTNRAMTGIDTVYLPAAPEFTHVRATLVRQIASLGGDVTALVPPSVHAFLASRRPTA